MSRLLSVVIIGVNEAKTIEVTIRSVLNLTKTYDCEYIYVDSGSKDNTIDIVRGFKHFRIFKVKSEYPTAALGRKVGSSYATGRFILFLDGDMQLAEDSDLCFCIDLLKNEHSIALVSGKLPEIIYKEGDIFKRVDDRYKVLKEIERMEEPGGYFLISRELLVKSGGFDHTIKRNEEIELMARIRKLGYTVVRTSKLTCFHHHHKADYKNIYKKFISNYFTDTWRVLWKCMHNYNLIYYFGFKKQALSIIRIPLTILMMGFVFISLINFKFMIVPFVYYITLLLISRFALINLVRKELSSIVTFFSIALLFIKNDTNYEVEEIKF
jgi:glycosyltransferase involved in cell wall biosynthesis